MRRASIALCLVFACLALACKDPGVIGATHACVPSCEDGMLCDPGEGRCVACLSSDDCSEDARCVSNACVPREPIRDPTPEDGDHGDEGEDGDESPDDGDEHPPEEEEGAAGEGGEDGHDEGEEP